MTTATTSALAALQPGEVGASTLSPTLSQRAVDGLTGWLARRTSRRGFLVKAGVLGTALAVDPVGYVLRPGTAYAAVCGPGAGASSGWTVFCATINDGVNACPPGSIAAGWWKADGASLCGGKARYIIDCNATCATCSTPGARAGICSSTCWSCSCESGLPGTCDQRKVCCNAFRYGQCNQDVRQVGGVHCRVVSCTPPWRFEECSTAPATDNRTRDHNSDRLPQAYTAITARYIALGENGSVLGATVAGEVTTNGGSAQRYQRGRISARTGIGARETVGPVAVRYVAVGAEAGPLGFPTTPPLPLPGGGSASRFQAGRISYRPDLGAFEVRGPLAVHYESLGAEGGPLGHPVSGQEASGAGFANRFERGRISWSADTGAHATRGPIAERYAELGAETGVLGFPVSEERVERDGPFKRPGATERRRSDFQNGSLAYDERTGLVVLLPRSA
ncbi:MAG: hypothetical protein JWN08_884 [Frankiales bacterium]|nr:hypothetical protein [Frankiales bacterium]